MKLNPFIFVILLELGLSIFAILNHHQIKKIKNKQYEKAEQILNSFNEIIKNISKSEIIKCNKKRMLGHNHGDNPCLANKNISFYLYDERIMVRKEGKII